MAFEFLSYSTVLLASVTGNIPCTMASSVETRKPISVHRPKRWSEEVEEAYRLQIAGYRDALEYEAIKGEVSPHSWLYPYIQS